MCRETGMDSLAFRRGIFIGGGGALAPGSRLNPADLLLHCVVVLAHIKLTIELAKVSAN